MTDVEFLQRLGRELMEGPAWSDVRGVVGPSEGPTLAGNELLVYPAATETTAGEVSLFRVIVEWEVAPDREFQTAGSYASNCHDPGFMVI